MSAREIECVSEVQVGDRVTVPWEVTAIRFDAHMEPTGFALSPVNTSNQPARSVSVSVPVDVLAYATSITREGVPLPTEPGVRFWGKAEDHPAEWWFVMQAAEIRYVSSSAQIFGPEAVERFGLVRLPDPEEGA